MKKKVIIYGTGIFFSKIIVFLLIPIYTRVFSPADYGYYDVLISNVTMLVSISFLEIWSGIIRYMFDGTDKYNPIKSFLKLLPVFLLIYAIAFLSLCFIMDIKFPILTVVYGISYLLFTVMNCICRGLNKTIDFVVSGLISALFSCGLSILFVLVFKKGIEYLLICQIIGFLVATFYCEIRTSAIRKSFKVHSSKSDLKKMILYCFPLMINSFSFLFLGTFNKNIILQKLGEDASGYYAFVLKFTAILSVCISIFAIAWQEVAFQKSDDCEKDKIYSYYIGLFIKVIGFAVPIYCIVLYYAAPVIGGTNYYESIQFFPLAMYATFISELSGILSIVIAVSKKTASILISTVIGAIVNVAIVCLITNRFKINAASIALLIGFSVTAIYRFIASRKCSKITINPIFLVIIIVEIVVVLICYRLKNDIVLISMFLLLGLIWLLFNYKLVKQLLGQTYKSIFKHEKQE